MATVNNPAATIEMRNQSTPFGAKVDFKNKAKTQTVLEIVTRPDNTGSDIGMHWAFRNGNVYSLDFFVPAGGLALGATLQAFGVQQKVGDSYAQAVEPDDVQTVVEVVCGNLLAGRWTKQTEGATPGISGLTGDLIEAVRRTFVAANGIRVEEFRDPVEGKVPAKAYLVAKYNEVLDKASEIRTPTGNDVQDAANAKIADELVKQPFKSALSNPAIQRQLAAIRKEKAEAAEANKIRMLEEAGIDLSDFE